jgi:hypothetical protein
MKKAKKLIGLMMAVVLAFSLLNIPALAADTSITASPVEYSLSVDGGKSISLWAYEIGGYPYFKLRDLAIALNNDVDGVKGDAYTPVGGELSKPDRTGDAEARYTDYSIRNINGWGNILAYLVDDSHYVKLSDLAAVLKAASSYDKEKHTAEIDTAPETVPAEETGEAFDNIALLGEGNSYSVNKDGNVILSYKSSATEAEAPLKLLPSGSGDESGLSAEDAGFYISEKKTAIAYGGRPYGEPVRVMTSEDMGKTWETSEAIAQNVGVSKLYVGFNTPDNGWLVITNFHGLGNEDHYVYLTADGGKTWTQIGNPNELYARVATGAGFSTPNIGFISYRVDFEPGPAIYRTLDGGYTWKKLEVTVPDGYDYNTPLSPVFSGANGVYPIEYRTDDGSIITYYLTSDDYGRTWTYDEAYNLA